MSRYLLVPVDDGEERGIMLPKGLMVNTIYDNLKDSVSNKKLLKSLTKEMSRKGIDEDESGCIVCKDTTVSNLNLRKVLADTCNNRFSKNNEQFYQILRDNNITL